MLKLLLPMLFFGTSVLAGVELDHSREHHAPLKYCGMTHCYLAESHEVWKDGDYYEIDSWHPVLPNRLRTRLHEDQTDTHVGCGILICVDKNNLTYCNPKKGDCEPGKRGLLLPEFPENCEAGQRKQSDVNYILSIVNNSPSVTTPRISHNFHTDPFYNFPNVDHVDPVDPVDPNTPKVPLPASILLLFSGIALLFSRKFFRRKES